jgi:hypothetical protein
MSAPLFSEIEMLAALYGLAFIFAAESAAKANQEAKPDHNDKICKVDTVVNSRIPKRICMTRAEWEQMEEDIRQAGRSSGNNNSHCPDSGSC